MKKIIILLFALFLTACNPPAAQVSTSNLDSSISSQDDSSEKVTCSIVYESTGEIMVEWLENRERKITEADVGKEIPEAGRIATKNDVGNYIGGAFYNALVEGVYLLEATVSPEYGDHIPKEGGKAFYPSEDGIIGPIEHDGKFLLLVDPQDPCDPNQKGKKVYFG